MLLRLLRLARRLREAGVPLAPRVIGRLIRVLYSCEISYLARIDESVVFPHKGLGVVIGDEVQIGARCRILQNVTIGGRGGVPGGPTLDEDVLVGAGASVLGPVHVGAGASIGANAVVLHDVPPGYVAVGVPARLLPPS